MLTCPFCKNPVQPHWKYCPNCSKPLISRTISNIDNNIHLREGISPIIDDNLEETPENDINNYQEYNVEYDVNLKNKLEKIEEELNLREKYGDPMGELLLKKAILFEKYEKKEEALKNFELALENFKEENKKLEEAICHNEIGLIYEENGVFEQAIYHFKQALLILREIDDVRKIISVLINLGNLYLNISDIENSYQKYQEALTLAEKAKLSYEAAVAANNMIDILLILKDRDRVLKILKSNENYFKKTNDIIGLIHTRIKFGKYYYELGEDEFDRSFQFFNEALKLIEKIESTLSDKDIARFTWECYLYLGNIYLSWNDDENAELFLTKSLEEIKKIDLKNNLKNGQVYESLAELHALKGEDDLAIEFYKKAMEIHEKFGEKLKIAELLNKMGDIYNKFTNDLEKAINSYENALRIYEELDYFKEIAIMLEKIANIHISKNQYDLAIKYFLKAKNYYSELKDEYSANLLEEKIKSLEDFV
ncbi:MAG: tetratricopeptide repeat protein [Promethearchaeota archaeon]